MGDKVVHLVPPVDKPQDANVVQLLEDLLEEAKLGNIVGVAAAYIRPNGTGRTVWATPQGTQFAVTGCVGMLHHDMCAVAAEA